MADKFKHRHWYVHLGGNPLEPENYYLVSKTPMCSSGKNICAIYALGFGAQPEDFSPNLKTAIANGLVTGMPQSTKENVTIVVLKGLK